MCIIGQFFAKLFRTSMYSDIENYLDDKYNMGHGKAQIILWKLLNKNYKAKIEKIYNK